VRPNVLSVNELRETAHSPAGETTAAPTARSDARALARHGRI
jgi:hypothetical protein